MKCVVVSDKMQTTQIRYRYSIIILFGHPGRQQRAQSLDPSSHASQAQSSVLLKTNCSYIIGAWRWGAPTKSVEEATNRVFRHASRWSPFLYPIIVCRSGYYVITPDLHCARASSESAKRQSRIREPTALLSLHWTGHVERVLFCRSRARLLWAPFQG